MAWAGTGVSTGAPDADGLLYAQHWEPVLSGPAGRLLDRVAALVAVSPAVAPERVTLLDIGAGTGSLALAAAERWPGAHIFGLDASAGMLSVARHRAAARWPGEGPPHLKWLTADAASVPLADASVDVVISSFMLQLVPDRRTVLLEAHRVLRPGGSLGFVTWLADELVLPADVEFDEAVYDLDLDEPETDNEESHPSDYKSLAEAQADLLGAGFEDARVEADELGYAWTRQEYRAFKEEFDERELLASLADADRARLMARVDERWAELPDSAFAMSATLVSATARRPSP